MSRLPACLAIGGSDSSGGAGIQADLRSFSKVGIHGCSAITALTAQNPKEIIHIEKTSEKQFVSELQAAFSYYDVRAVKTGMLVDSKRVHWVIQSLQHCADQNIPIVVDPVLIASSGTHLLAKSAMAILQNDLFPLATLITPNLDEAEVLLNHAVDDPVEDAAALMMRYGTAVLLKGGHGKGEMLLDVLCEKSGDVSLFSHPRKVLSLDEAHGTGCRLAATITAWIGKGYDVQQAVEHALNP
ncbi:MAG: bifunctional hydroxymethylpyrimidine kinase/phosphomethylpyrimidine kinase [Mariprofundaceae bacterium]